MGFKLFLNCSAKNIFCFCVWLITLFNSALAANDHIPIVHLGSREGLSNNSVTSIFKDHYGFMWFGTYDGLNKYDGYSFTIFRNRINDTSSLINNHIYCINEDSAHNIWIGTSVGLSIYDQIAGKFKGVTYRPYFKKDVVKLTARVNNIQIDGTGNILVSTNLYGMVVFKKGALVGNGIPCINKGSKITDYHVQYIHIDAQKRVWVFVKDIGLCLYNKTEEDIVVVNNTLGSATCIADNGSNILWIGSVFGLYEYNILTNELHIQVNNNPDFDKIRALRYYQKTLWIATAGAGLSTLDIKTGLITHPYSDGSPQSILSTVVHDLLIDHEGRKWVGTLRGGVSIIDPSKKFQVIVNDPNNKNSLISNFVLSFYEEHSGNIWIGTDGGGLSCWDRSKDSFKNFKHDPHKAGSLSSDFVTSIIGDNQNNIWVATYFGGINRFNKITHSFEHYHCPLSNNKKNDDYVWVLHIDHNKRLWAGTFNTGGLYYFNELHNCFELFDSRLKDILSLHEDQDGYLWAGNFNELYKIDTKNHSYKSFYIGRPVRCIYEDKANNFWIGTEGLGLLAFDKTKGIFKTHSMVNGLCNNTVMNILEDTGGDLWLSTFNGLSRFNPTSKKFDNFYEGDGLPANEFNYNAALVTHSGEFLFGGPSGFIIMNPAAVTANYKMPVLQLTSLSIDNTAVEQLPDINNHKGLYDLEQIKVPYNKAVISAQFAALEYSAPDKISYAYYLEGWDKGWNYVGKQRIANYTHLTEGSYILHIKSTDASGVWNTTEKRLNIIVTPPWYRSWWAFLIYIMLIGLTVYLYIVYKFRHTKLRYEINLVHFAAKKEKELNDKKSTFFTNISHEFRAPLSLIVNPLKDMLYDSRNPIDPGELNMVLRNARRLLGLVDQLLLFRKTEEFEQLRITRLNFAEVCKEVFLCFTHQASKKNIDYQFICKTENIELYADREKIEIILFNIISNALKFTPEKGTVILNLQETDNVVQILVKDSGPGIPEVINNKLYERFYQVRKEETGFGLGLYVAKNYVESHSGKITHVTKNGEGTEFYIEFQKGKTHFNERDIFVDDTYQSGLLKELLDDPDSEVASGQQEEFTGNDQESIVEYKKSMLVLDDDLEMRGYIARIFSENFKVYQSDSGEAAILLVKKYLPDIIISDVMMRGMSGIEFCNYIKEDIDLNHIPVILITGASSTELKLKGVECGADDYISKPFDKELLIARVNTILKSRNNLQKYFYNEITLQKNNYKISNEYKSFLDKCIAIVEKHLSNDSFDIKMLTEEMNMSHSNLYKKVKSISGLSVNAFIRFIRLRKAAELYINSQANVNEVAFSVGFTHSKYFRIQFHKLFGMNPSDYIKKYRKSFQDGFIVDEKRFKPK